MGQYRQTTKKVELAATTSPGDIQRVWDAPTGVPLKGVSIFLSTAGQVYTIAGTLDWRVLYGGRWSGVPYAEGSTHSGGISQGSGSIATGAEIASVLFEDTSLLPANNGTMLQYSTPIVLELTNKKASVMTVYVTFVSEIISCLM